MEWLVVTLFSLFAGFIDSIVGGGGLILVPALFATFPSTAPATLLGTNKTGSVFGTLFSAWRYARRVNFVWAVIIPAAFMAFIGALLGAWSVTQVSGEMLRKALPFILFLLLIYTLAKKDLGLQHNPNANAHSQILPACCIGVLIGFYDGFFGPGTGSFFIFALVRFLGYDFLNASATAKLLNIASNLAAIILLGMVGHIWWNWALALALANILGGFLGTALALRFGAGFVRWIFIFVVIVLIVRSAYDAFFL